MVSMFLILSRESAGTSTTAMVLPEFKFFMESSKLAWVTVMSSVLMYLEKRRPSSSTLKEANPEREGVMEIPSCDSMLVINALNTNNIKNRTEICRKKMVKNFLLLSVSLSSHLVMVVNFKMVTPKLFSNIQHI